MNGGMILAGAAGRLLPVSIPFRFFILAVYFHILAWVALAWASATAVDFIGGLGPALAALHIITLGVFCSAAIGATLQLLPVATRAPIGALWPAKVIFVLMVVGVHSLIAGMATGWALLLEGGGAATVAALGLFTIVTARNLLAAPQASTAIAYAWAALIALSALLISGFLMILDFPRGFLSDHASLARAHAVLGVFGFFGLMSMGFSAILLPMFALSPSLPPGGVRAVLALSILAVAGAGSGLALGMSALVTVAIICGLAAAVIHVGLIELSLRKRMRRKLDLAFALMRGAHGAAIVGLVVALMLSLGWSFANATTLFGWIVIGGWLTTFLFGILQRILPFLASMHAGKIRGRAPTLSEIGPPRPLQVHAVAHMAALILMAAAILSGQSLFVLLASIAGGIGAVAFAWFAIVVVTHIVPRASSTASAP